VDLDDIDQWSRELLQREARKRGYVNAGMYSRPELIKLILRHDYGSPGSVKQTARNLLGSARGMIMRGIEAATHARLGRGRKRAGELSRRPSRARGEDAWRAQRAAAGHANAGAAHGERGAGERAGAAASGAAGAAPSERFAGAQRNAAPPGENPSSAQASAIASPFAPGASNPVAQKPELRPPDVGSAPLELQEALNQAQLTAAASPLESQPASARVDPSPELRPPAVEGVAQLRPPDAGASPLELNDALNQAQLTAAAAPMQPPSGSVRVDPSPELRPPMAHGFSPAGGELRAQSEMLELAMPREQPLSPWRASLPRASLRPPKPVVAQPLAAAPEPAFPSGVEQLTYGPRSEYGVSLRWQVTSGGVERARLVLGGPGELAVRIIAVRVDAHAEVHSEILDHGPVEHTGVWIAPLSTKATRYVSSIGLRTAERFVSIAHAAS